MLIAGLYTSLPNHLYASEKSSIAKNYSLVGVIANVAAAKKHKGIAVVRELDRKRSLTVSTGEALPYSGWVVTVIERDQVIVKNGEQTEVIRYQLDGETEAPKIATKTLDDSADSPREKPSEKSVNTYPDDDSEWMEFYRHRLNDSDPYDTYHTVESRVTVLGATPEDEDEE